MEYWIGLDLGTSAIKGVALKKDGSIIRQAKTSIKFKENKNINIKEIDPESYVEQLFALIKKLIVPNLKLKAISWAAASGNLLLLDENYSPISPIYSWLDKRPNEEKMKSYYNQLPLKKIHQICGWPFSPQFPLGRLIWLSKTNRALLAKSHKIVMSNDYLTWKLTGKWVVDESNATTMYLYDQMHGEKSPFLLGLAEIDNPDKICNVVHSKTVIGPISEAVSEILQIKDKLVSFVLGSFDHPSAARAVKFERENQLLLSCGTSWVGCLLLNNREKGLEMQLLIDPFEKSWGGFWLGMFSVSGIGNIFDRWVLSLINLLQIDVKNPFKYFDQLAEKGDSKNLPIVNLNSEDINKRLITLLKEHSEANIACSILEEVVFKLFDLIRIKEIDLSAINEILLVGGPTESFIWPQIIANIFQTNVVIRYGQTAGAVGAAMMAAEATGTKIKNESKDIEIVFNQHLANKMKERYIFYLNCEKLHE